MTTTPLTPIDHLFTGAGSYPIEFVFAYDGVLDADRLRRTLDDVLQHFGPVRSRLAAVDGHTCALEPAADGAAFRTATSDEPLDLARNAYDFLDPVRTAPGEPLARFKLTETPAGSVLGVSISHAVGDGFSYFHFLSSWARMYHGKPFHPPSLSRDPLIPRAPGSSGQLDRDEVLAAAGVFWADRRPEIDRQRLVWETHALPKRRLAELLREARREVDVRLSYNDVITAYLWKRYVPGWMPTAGDDDGEREGYISCPVDFRRLLPSLPPTYFGNAVCLATDSLDRDTLAGSGLGQLAARVRRLVARVDPDYIERVLAALDALRRQHGLAAMEETHVIHPHHGLLVTNLSRLPVHELEFDAGPPARFAILTPAERGAVVLPADDGVEVRVCLPSA